MKCVIVLYALLTFCYANTIVRPDNNGGIIIGDGPVKTYDTVLLQGTAYPNELDMLLQDQDSFPDLKIYNIDSLAVQRLPSFSTLAAIANVGSSVFLATGLSCCGTTDSIIYKFNTTSNAFTSYQTVSTLYNKKWTSFTIGTTTYMIYANSYTIGSNNPSTIYTVSSTGLTFFQNLTTIGINSWEHIKYNENDYLVGATVNSSLTAFKWNGTAFNSDVSYFIVTGNIYAMDSFQSSGSSYLALSMYSSGNVLVYTYNGSGFSLTKNISSSQPSSVKFFTISGVEYLAIAEAGRTPNTNYVYKWNSGSPVLYQSISVTDIIGWEFFDYNSNQYLISAHSLNTTVNAPSYLYKWDGHSFGKISDITTVGAMQWISITINSLQYLFVNCKTAFNTAESILYQLP